MAKQYSYERRIVCFIDILGFSNLVRATVNNGIDGKVNFMNICGALYKLDDLANTLSEKMTMEDVRTTQFSDSVVISFPWKEEENSIVAAIFWIKNIQMFLIKEHCILLRGGVTIGEMIHNEKMIVGPAMIDAYALESKDAIYPRILIDSKVVPLFNTAFDRCRINKNIDTHLVNKDDDDRYYIDYFNLSERDRNGSFCYYNDYLPQLKTVVASNIDNNDARIREKNSWMNNKMMASNLIKWRKFGSISIRLN